MGLASGDYLGLDAAVEQVVVHLGRDRPGEMLGPGRPVGVAYLPGGEVAEADVPHLARAYEIVKRSKSLLDRRLRIGDMDLVEVDIVGRKAAQAVLDLRHDPAPRRAPLRPRLGHRHPDLGGDDESMAPTGQQPAELALGRAGALVGT